MVRTLLLSTCLHQFWGPQVECPAKTWFYSFLIPQDKTLRDVARRADKCIVSKAMVGEVSMVLLDNKRESTRPGWYPVGLGHQIFEIRTCTEFHGDTSLGKGFLNTRVLQQAQTYHKTAAARRHSWKSRTGASIRSKILMKSYCARWKLFSANLQLDVKLPDGFWQKRHFGL